MVGLIFVLKDTQFTGRQAFDRTAMWFLEK